VGDCERREKMTRNEVITLARQVIDKYGAEPGIAIGLRVHAKACANVCADIDALKGTGDE
jgi:hypothetical protein